jgi:hypothetical protein
MNDKLQKTGSSNIEKTGSGIKLNIASGLAAGLAAGLSSIELPRMFNQLIIFLLDGSGSMTFNGASGHSKGHEVHQAVINVLERLNESKNKSSFDIAFWAFSNENVEMFPIKPVKEYNLVKDCFNPCEYITDYSNTKLSDLLEEVNTLVNQYLEKYEGQNRKALIIIIGDGAVNDFQKSLAIKLKMDDNPLINFSSILFESPDWQEKYKTEAINAVKNTFSKLASTDADYMSTVDPEKIRSHMINSVTKVSKI